MRVRPRLVSAASLSGAVLVSLLGPPAGAAPARVSDGGGGTATAACAIEELPVPAGTEASQVTGGDPSGRHLIGWVRPAFGVETPAVWHRGTVEVMDFGYPNGQAFTDAARDGTLVGTGVPTGPSRAFLVSPEGEFRELGGSGGHAAAIDADGTVVGGLRPGLDQVPAIWRKGSYDSPIVVESEGDSTVLQGIAKGRSVGTAYDPNPHRAYVWGRDLRRHLLPNIDDTGYVEVIDAAGRFAVGVEESFDPDAFHVLRWRLRPRTVEDVQVPEMFVTAVNRHGVISGQGAGGPILVIGDQLQPLPPLLPDEIAMVNAVFSSGDAAGWAWDETSNSVAVRWRCS